MPAPSQIHFSEITPSNTVSHEPPPHRNCPRPTLTRRLAASKHPTGRSELKSGRHLLNDGLKKLLFTTEEQTGAGRRQRNRRPLRSSPVGGEATGLLTGKTHKSLQLNQSAPRSARSETRRCRPLLSPLDLQPGRRRRTGQTSWKESLGGFLSAPPLNLSTILMASDTTHTEEVRVTRNSRSAGDRELTLLVRRYVNR